MSKTTKAVTSPAYRNLSPEKYKEFYKLLVTHNYAEAASQIGMDAYYQGASLRTAGYQIMKDITEQGGPKSIGIDEELAEMVEQSIESRKVFKGRKPEAPTQELEFTPTDMLDPTDSKQVVVGGRNKAAMLLHKKFDMINKNPKMLKETSLSQLGTVFGILFDKSQIIQGQATENIAVMSKISDDMSPEDTLNAILKDRENEIIEKLEKN